MKTLARMHGAATIHQVQPTSHAQNAKIQSPQWVDCLQVGCHESFKHSLMDAGNSQCTHSLQVFCPRGALNTPSMTCQMLAGCACRQQDVPCQLSHLAKARGVLDLLIVKLRHRRGRSCPLGSTLHTDRLRGHCGHKPLHSAPWHLRSTSWLLVRGICGCHGLVLLWLLRGSDLGGDKMVVFTGVQMQTWKCAADKAQSLEAPRSWRPAGLEECAD